MTKPEEKTNTETQTDESELEEAQLEEVTGGTAGVGFLQGQIVNQQRAAAQLPSGGGNQLAAAQSLTTLECWEQCTVHISGC
jgi:hypothetical protein